MLPRRPRLASSLPFLTCASIALAGCGSESPPTPAPSPVKIAVDGGFTAELVDTDRLVIASADGRVLLDGLPPGAVADKAPPLVGFAVRDVTTTYEMQVGSFKPSTTYGGPWRPASHLVNAGKGALDLTGDDGRVLAHVVLTAPTPGHLVAELTPGEGPERRISWGFTCNDDDHFAGFGAQSLDVDHRGFTVPTFVSEQGVGKSDSDGYAANWFVVGTRHASQVPIPEYLSRRGYLLLAETDHRAVFALCSEGDKKAARLELDLPVKVHVFDGPAPALSLDRATSAFGRPRMPPRVAFAPWMDGIYGSANVRAVAKKLRDNTIPSSVIWTEDWRGGEQSGDAYRLKEEWEVDTTLYPDLPALSKDLHTAGFDFFVYFNPFVYKTSKAWPETAPKGWLVQSTDGTPYTFTGAKFTDCGLIDLDNPQARDWAVKKMQAAIALGADGWMNDFAEWLPTDGKTAKGPSEARHNLYPVLWQETARAAIDGVTDGQERLFFGRSGWIGTPALADVIWAGDQRTDFEKDDGMPTVLPIGIGLGIVGISTYGHDIGGYQSSTNSTSTKELFFRWTELGAWSPVMRTHHGTAPKLEWTWDKDPETIDHFRRYTRLHTALVPYLESLGKTASESGLPIWRGLMLGYPDDAAVWPITDEVMIGDGVLLAPVMTEAAISRAVYLPKGRWYPWAGGAAIDGEATVMASAPVAEIPVYARPGAIVPMYPDGVMTLVHGSAAVPDASSVGDDRVVALFLGAAGDFHEASGLQYTIEHIADGSGAVTATWQGAALSACAAIPKAPCLTATADGATANVTGPGSLAVTLGGTLAAKITVAGGAAARKLTLLVRR
ncbi:MAG: TIM-barrel domain-containing protein [Byssovorax sp.]